VIGRALRLDAPPAAMTFWRWLIALALLLPFTYGYLCDNARQVRRSWRILCLLGLLATVLQHIPLYCH
jgi:drug/metabolite transporter (DMT)-like permease